MASEYPKANVFSGKNAKFRFQLPNGTWEDYKPLDVETLLNGPGTRSYIESAIKMVGGVEDASIFDLIEDKGPGWFGASVTLISGFTHRQADAIYGDVMSAINETKAVGTMCELTFKNMPPEPPDPPSRPPAQDWGWS